MWNEPTTEGTKVVCQKSTSLIADDDWIVVGDDQSNGASVSKKLEALPFIATAAHAAAPPAGCPSRRALPARPPLHVPVPPSTVRKAQMSFVVSAQLAIGRVNTLRVRSAGASKSTRVNRTIVAAGAGKKKPDDEEKPRGFPRFVSPSPRPYRVPPRRRNACRAHAVSCRAHLSSQRHKPRCSQSNPNFNLTHPKMFWQNKHFISPVTTPEFHQKGASSLCQKNLLSSLSRSPSLTPTHARAHVSFASLAMTRSRPPSQPPSTSFESNPLLNSHIQIIFSSHARQRRWVV